MHILVNSTSIFASVVTGYQGMASAVFSQTLAVGDRIDFVVGAAGDLPTNATIGLNASLATTIADTTPPTITATVSPSVLWPPNGKRVQVRQPRPQFNLQRDQRVE
ncbi:MAG: hypothetical protein V1929_12845 [bacterium]